MNPKDTSTPTAIAALMVALQTTQRAELTAQVALWDEVCGMDEIPTDVKNRLNELKAVANAELKKTLDTGDVLGTLQAGQEVAWAFRSMESQLEYMGKLLAGSRETMTKLASRLKQTIAPEAVAKQIDAALAERIAAGAIMEKSAVEAAVEAARKQGADVVRQQVALQADRTKRLKEAKLPVLEVALNAETPEAFDALFAEAQTRAGKLAVLKVDLNGNDAIAKLAFCPPDQFEGQLAVLTNVLANQGKPTPDGKLADPLAVPAPDTRAQKSLAGLC